MDRKYGSVNAARFLQERKLIFPGQLQGLWSHNNPDNTTIIDQIRLACMGLARCTVDEL